MNYKVDISFPDTSILDFYNKYLVKKDWQIFMEFENSWDTYYVAMKGLEHWTKSFRRSWVDKNKEKVFDLGIMYKTPIGIKDEPQEWKEEWLSTQEIFIHLQDYQSYTK